MPGPWKAWKTKSGFPTLSTVPWKSRRKREIPTFPPPGFASMEKWKTKSRFPTFPRPLATITTVLSLKTKNQRKEVGRCAASSFPVRFSCSSFDWKMLTSVQCSVDHTARATSQLVGGGVLVTSFPSRQAFTRNALIRARGDCEVRSWKSEESEVESCKHQDNANIHCQPFPESVSEEQKIHTNDDGYHRHHVKHASCLFAHLSKTRCRPGFTRRPRSQSPLVLTL